MVLLYCAPAQILSWSQNVESLVQTFQFELWCALGSEFNDVLVLCNVYNVWLIYLQTCGPLLKFCSSMLACCLVAALDHSLQVNQSFMLTCAQHVLPIMGGIGV